MQIQILSQFNDFLCYPRKLLYMVRKCLRSVPKLFWIKKKTRKQKKLLKSQKNTKKIVEDEEEVEADMEIENGLESYGGC